MAINFSVNGRAASTDAPAATPLLWVIREGLKLTGTKFGCGTGLCGACMVHIDGERAFSCQTQVSEISDKSVTTIEGLSAEADVRALDGVRERIARIATEGQLDRELAGEGDGLRVRLRAIRDDARQDAARRELEELKRRELPATA